MNVLVVGRGGREHSIVMKLAESERIENLYAAPGNGGMSAQAKMIAIDEMDIEGLVRFAKEAAIDLTIIGPEAPLNAGIANRFHEAGLAVFAPTKEAALLEGSKRFAKEIMEKYEIPTAAYETFTDVEEAKVYIEEKGAPIVIKADGLAAGKGVVVAETKEDAFQAVDDMLVSKAFDSAGATIVIEEFLDGKEFSLMAFVHENKVYPMVTARDHKRAFDNDAGPNTGGMGAFAPVPDVTAAHLSFAMENILQKTVNGMIEEGRPFTGILYAGLIMTEGGPKVIEFNTRFGDPETQVVLPLLKNDLLQVFLDVLAGKDPQLTWEDQTCVGVVLASNGYPGAYNKARLIPSFNTPDNEFIVHAGTIRDGEALVSDGGRVLLAGAKDTTLAGASSAVYNVLESASDMSDFFYRKDIGKA
ncbi:phosphoribosylamine--glycine ligase [Oceanobacillus sp. 143]|uniref:Phosphoribosylamine--glycine ligase n=1 Tax=Oceanobacillus zhaokaii TaxID=2052660 RepID=A0A345PDW7_9BACI|nr:phosphoribosylamine--glycine ligase [Oceanobacillus zhaokaii]AXI08197.1 phosphoribosylamine--glycine ligase [Oceanobacillus zhaokaii]QGS68135.1 phosphoribosylamine--glycine ligase [Oceanobacillus sp. 143]